MLLVLGLFALFVFFVYEATRVNIIETNFANWSYPPLCVYGYHDHVLISTACYDGYTDDAMGPLLASRELGVNHNMVSDQIVYGYGVAAAVVALAVVLGTYQHFYTRELPWEKYMDEIMALIEKEKLSGATQGVVYIDLYSVDDNVVKWTNRLRKRTNMRFAVDLHPTECDGTRAYALSWTTKPLPISIDTKPRILTGGRSGELIKRLIDMLHWFEREGNVSEDWSSDDITTI